MCGRYRHKSDKQRIADAFEVSEHVLRFLGERMGDLSAFALAIQDDKNENAIGEEERCSVSAR